MEPKGNFLGLTEYLELVRGVSKEIGEEEPCYSTKISIFSFIWAGLADLHKASQGSTEGRFSKLGQTY